MAEEPSYAREDFEDLNAVGLLGRMCAPFRRAPAEDEWQGDGRFLDATYAPPFGLFESPSSPGVKLLRLERCGQRASLRFSGEWPQLAGRTLFWWKSRVLYAMRLRSHGRQWHGKAYRILLPNGVRRTEGDLRVTANRVFVVVGQQIYGASLPWGPALSPKRARLPSR